MGGGGGTSPPVFLLIGAVYWSRQPKVFQHWTHWGRVTHICVSKLIIIGSYNGLSPDRRQAIIWTNAGILLIWPLGKNFSEILIEILTFSFKKMHLKVSSAKRRPFCLGLNVLTSLLFRPAMPYGVMHLDQYWFMSDTKPWPEPMLTFKSIEPLGANSSEILTEFQNFFFGENIVYQSGVFFVFFFILYGLHVVLFSEWLWTPSSAGQSGFTGEYRRRPGQLDPSQ